VATPQEALEAFLLADSAVTALVGVDPGNGTPLIAPEGTLAADDGYPRLTYQVIDWPIGNGLSGPTGYARPRIQMDLRAKGALGYDQVWALEEAVRTSRGGNPTGPKLNGFYGVLAGCDIRRIRLADRQDLREAPIHAEEFGLHRVILDFVVEFFEPP
jgi:hypothetical protein